jgi:hypothetical protein
MGGFIIELLGFGLETDATSILDQINISSGPICNTMMQPPVLAHVILITFDPSVTPAKLLAWTTPSVLRASNSSHQPKRKSRAMSLNHGVKELPITEHQNDVATQVRFLHTLILKHRL